MIQIPNGRNSFWSFQIEIWTLFGIWPACAKPRLQKPCGGQALRRRQGFGYWDFDACLVPAMRR